MIISSLLKPLSHNFWMTCFSSSLSFGRFFVRFGVSLEFFVSFLAALRFGPGFSSIPVSGGDVSPRRRRGRRAAFIDIGLRVGRAEKGT